MNIIKKVILPVSWRLLFSLRFIGKNSKWNKSKRAPPQAAPFNFFSKNFDINQSGCTFSDFGPLRIDGSGNQQNTHVIWHQ